MSERAISRFRACVTGCARLLYWACFKPYTLNRWLQEIDPDLDDTTNPFRLRERFAANPRLRRYAGQCWWLAAVTPLLVTLLVGALYSLLAPEPFDWARSGLFLLGWWLGLWLARGARSRLERWANWLIWAGFIVGLVWGGGWQLAPDLMRTILHNLPWGLGYYIAALAPILASIWPLAVGVAVGVAFGVAVGVAWILGVLRVYFWLPELAWTLILAAPPRDGQRVG